MEKDLLKTAVPLILEWYRVHKRDLPWRHNRTPYTALVAELMLQQTRVEAVKERYVEFLRRFPTAEALANAGEDEVLKCWEGLGYYSRARNLHKAAKMIAAEGFPETWAGVRKLPGVGDYTAGAVCSIALGLPEPAVDGNVLRVLTRLLADGSNIDEPATKSHFAQLLREVYPPETGDFCEGLMELGALVCVPNGSPLCSLCPWRELCRARLAGREEDFPVRSEKKARKVVNLAVLVLEKDGSYALRKRGEGLLSGLWEFPTYPLDSPPPLYLRGEGREGSEIPASLGEIIATKKAKHVFTHVEWHMTGQLVKAREHGEDFIWVTAEELKERYALPSAFKAFKEWVK